MVKKDIAVNDDHIIEKNDLIQINGTKMDASSFILDAPVVIDNYYIEKGDTITVIKSNRKADKEDNKDSDTDKKNETDKEDKNENDDTVDLEIEENVIIGKYIFEIGDKIRIIPKSTSTVSRMNERSFRLNEDLTIGNKKLYKNSVIEVLPKELAVLNLSGSDVNILREDWV